MSLWTIQKSLFRMSVALSNLVFGKEATHRNPFVRWLAHRRLDLLEALSPARRRQARFERDNPDKPWLVPAAIEAIEAVLRPDFVAFEWGAGRSTLWLARRVAHVTSVEGRGDWLAEVRRNLNDAGLSEKVDLKHCAVTSEHDFRSDEVARYAGAIESFADGSLDFVLIDGHFRDACVVAAARKVRPGGYVVIDNTEAMNVALIDLMPVAGRQAWNNGIWETTLVKIGSHSNLSHD